MWLIVDCLCELAGGWFGWLLWAFQCCHFWVCVQARLVWMHIVLISVWAVQEAAFVWLQVGLVGLHGWLIFMFSWLSSGLGLLIWTCLRLVVGWLAYVVSLVSSIFSWLSLLVKTWLAYDCRCRRCVAVWIWQEQIPLHICKLWFRFLYHPHYLRYQVIVFCIMLLHVFI